MKLTKIFLLLLILPCAVQASWWQRFAQLPTKYKVGSVLSAATGYGFMLNPRKKENADQPQVLKECSLDGADYQLIKNNNTHLSNPNTYWKSRKEHADDMINLLYQLYKTDGKAFLLTPFIALTMLGLSVKKKYAQYQSNKYDSLELVGKSRFNAGFIAYKSHGWKRNIFGLATGRNEERAHCLLQNAIDDIKKDEDCVQVTYNPRSAGKKLEFGGYFPNHEELTKRGFNKYTQTPYQQHPDTTDASYWAQEFDKPRLEEKTNTYYLNVLRK